MTTDITEPAQSMCIERIKQIALGAAPIMGEKTRLAITALYFYRELKICTEAFQAAGLNQLKAEEALEKAQVQSSKWLEAYHKAVSISARYEERIAELEESNAQVIQSRDHYKRMTEEGLKQLAESRTVKLPASCADDEYFIDGVFQPMRYERDVERALRAAGIKWEDE